MILSTVYASAQELPTIFDKLYGADIASITLHTDLSNLITERRSEDYQPAAFSITDKDGNKEIHQIKIKSRGKFRRKVCQFPPIKLNFSKGALRDYGYEGQYDKLKLVTHCLDGRSISKENVAKEYLAYKLYNVISENSYRAQLIEITYIDTEGKVDNLKRYGFVLEDTDEMAKRIGGTECEECLNLAANQLVNPAETEMALFQYMIGNEDWNTAMMRNLKMVRLDSSQKVIPVPYDFDFAGLVDAPYALPNSDFGLLSVKQRHFMGLKVEEDTLMNTLQAFADKKPQLYEVVEKDPLLKRTHRKEVITYLDSFFQLIEPALEGKGTLPVALVEQAILGGMEGLKQQTAK